MYHISLYFDEKTSNRITSFMRLVAKHTKNDEMIVGKVPPHITFSIFKADNEKAAIETLKRIAARIKQDSIRWIGIGSFLPSVIYISPLQDEYLFNVCRIIYEEVIIIDGVKVNERYQPYNWVPHTTIAKNMTNEQLKIAFEVMQGCFGMFEGNAIKIGLAKTNPYNDIFTLELSLS